METPRMIFDKFTNGGKDITQERIIDAIQHALDIAELPVRPSVKWYDILL